MKGNTDLFSKRPELRGKVWPIFPLDQFFRQIFRDDENLLHLAIRLRLLRVSRKIISGLYVNVLRFTATLPATSF